MLSTPLRNQNRAGHKVTGQKCLCECNGPSGVCPFDLVPSVVLSLGAGCCPMHLHSLPNTRENAARKGMQLMNLPISSGQGFEEERQGREQSACLFGAFTEVHSGVI